MVYVADSLGCKFLQVQFSFICLLLQMFRANCVPVDEKVSLFKLGAVVMGLAIGSSSDVCRLHLMCTMKHF